MVPALTTDFSVSYKLQLGWPQCNMMTGPSSQVFCFAFIYYYHLFLGTLSHLGGNIWNRCLIQAWLLSWHCERFETVWSTEFCIPQWNWFKPGAMYLGTLYEVKLQSTHALWVEDLKFNSHISQFSSRSHVRSLRNSHFLNVIAYLLRTNHGCTSLVVQCLRICLAMQGTWVQPLVRKLRSYMPQGK